MQTLDQSLAQLCKNATITQESALEYCRFCCKNWRSMGEGLIEVWGKGLLGGQSEQAVDELDLLLDFTGLNLSLPNHMHRLVAL